MQGTKYNATRSAVAWTLGLDGLAASTVFAILLMVLSIGNFVNRTRTGPGPFTEPATIYELGNLGTETASPVIIDSSISVSPAMLSGRTLK